MGGVDERRTLEPLLLSWVDTQSYLTAFAPSVCVPARHLLAGEAEGACLNLRLAAPRESLGSPPSGNDAGLSGTWEEQHL